ncbi:unnamed protein product [Owenia fusiformis]|uniref:Coactosin-like protein n=1 Tax=Owenia fusiformis TaxID=6347 RepID=A0A8J1TVI5_OWEFU|nr:unnamed protein product [Owenia fusiformis]
MSTTAEFEDVDAFKEAIGAVRDDSNSTNYTVVGHVNGSPNLLGVVATGENIGDVLDLFSPTEMMYALVRLSTKVDMSTTVKFVYIHWMGDQIPFAKRGRMGVVHGSIKELFQPSHVEIETSILADLEEENIMALLANVEGTKDKSIEAARVDPKHERSFIGRGTSRAVEESPKKIAPKGVAIETGEGVVEAIADVRNDESPCNWCLVGYEGGNPKAPLKLFGSGDEGVGGLIDLLDDSEVLYGMCRVTDVVDDITTVKFVYINWIGETVKPMTKAKTSTYKASIEELFSPHHASIFGCDRSEVTEKRIMDVVTASSGSKSFVM